MRLRLMIPPLSPRSSGTVHTGRATGTPLRRNVVRGADAERVRAILAEAGYRNIHIEAAERPMRLAEGLSMEESASRLLALGPVSRLLAQESEDTRQRVHESVVRALLPYSDSEGVTFSGTAARRSAGGGRTAGR